MGNILKNILQKFRKNKTVTIVSGLPRSGTSMMMRMLEAGGLEIVTDGVRKADEDNPRGYYEYERVKKIKEDDSWLEECKGRAVKMVSMLLYHLPDRYKYRIIFMQRNMQEMLASQNRMLERLGKKGGDLSDEEMAEKYEKHLQEIRRWLDNQTNIQVLYVDYHRVIKDPVGQSDTINHFLGGRLNRARMIEVVEPTLYRQRVDHIKTR